MFDDEDGISQVAEAANDAQHFVVVARMNADSGLVHDVKYAREVAAELACQAHALSFAAGESWAWAVECEVVEADVDEEFKAAADFWEYVGGDVALGGQGAPLVPAGDRLLFPDYDYCLNLGGFSNISYEQEGRRIAYDISPVNLAMQHVVRPLGMEYDKDGETGRRGRVDADLLQALDALEDVDFWQFSQTESVKILLLKSKILQDMGLVEKAITVLSDQAEYIPDPQLKAEILFDIANCYITQGQFQLAHEELTKLLLVVRPGPLAYKIAIRLAEICSMLGLNSQAISVCTQLMEADIPEQTRNKAATILAMAHNAQQDYDSAALALLDKQ